jgi:hypothetical protein
MFFDIFKGEQKPSNVVPFPTWKDIPPPNTSESSDRGVNNKDAAYTIGVNEHNCVQVKTGYTTLTMTDVGVVQLIEDLAHHIRHTYTVEITKLD